jgi:hypothetical protein
MNLSRLRDRGSESLPAWAFLLLAFALVAATVFVLRYDSLWIEQDTSGMTGLIENVRQQATLSPSSGKIYDHGFAYQAVTSFILNLTALPIRHLQSTIWPLLAAPALALAALAFFVQAAKDRRTAALAGLLLFFQGDLLFTILRGSHEKLDWPLTMVALMLLIRGSGRSLRSLMLHIFLFYLVVFAIMATNVFFASTFIVAIVLSLTLGVLVRALLHRRFALAGDHRRLLYVALSCVLLLFVMAVYLYPPALRNLRALAGIAEQVSTVMLGFSPTDSPYGSIAYGWISRTAYLGLTLFTWLLIAGSFLEWLSWGRDILRGEKTAGIRENLVWLLYAGFAIQVAIGVAVDYAGVLGQNLQLRIFPGFTLMAVVLLAHLVRRILAACQGRGRSGRAVLALSVLLFGWFSIASVLKATNEPVLSNKWVFYSASEAEAMGWADGYLQSAYVWTAHDERLYGAGTFLRGGPSLNDNTFRGYRFAGYEKYVVFSERERMRGLRMGLPMPPVLEWNRAYDNGDVYLYHKRPQTPYQR